MTQLSLAGCILSTGLALGGVAWAEASAAPPVAAETVRREAKKPVADPSRALELAIGLRRAGLFVDAVRVARNALGKARGIPLVSDLVLEVARSRMDAGDHRAALRECDRLEKIDRTKQHICIAEAQLLRRRGSLALPAAEAALGRDPRNYDAMVAQGRALAQVGKSEAAETTLRAAIEMDSRRPEGHFALGRLLLDRGETDAALDVLRKGRGVDPDHPDILVLIGEYGSDDTEALAALERSIAVRPTSGTAHALLGRRLLAAGRLDPAEKALAEALRLSPRQADWRAALGEIHLARGDADGALKEAQAALAVVSNHPGAKLLEANALAAKGDIDLAIVVYQAASSLARRDPKPLSDAARACAQHERPTTGQAFAERVTAEFPAWAPGWEVAGDLAAASGDKRRAVQAYRRALSGKGPLDKAAVRKKLAALE